LETQRAIARILGTLDDKIELSRRMNHTLEALVQAIFQSWFVDFDPVVAKAAGRHAAGMCAETASLFPNQFQETAVGPIPKGWQTGKVSDFLTVARDAVVPSDHPSTTFEHYSIPAFDEGRRPKRELGSGIKSNKYIVTADAVLISKLNPEIPRVWLPWVAHEIRSICSTEFLVTLPRKPATREFLYALFSSGGFRDEFATLVTGTSNSHQRVKPDDFSRMYVVVPSDDCIAVFTRMVGPLLERVAQNNRQSWTIASLRDALLPELLSGQLQVTRAEKIVP
jgi:type I restriction enzyme S subunit